MGENTNDIARHVTDDGVESMMTINSDISSFSEVSLLGSYSSCVARCGDSSIAFPTAPVPVDMMVLADIVVRHPLMLYLEWKYTT